MELRFNVTGPDRKRLAAAIAEFTQCRAEYQYMPTCAYVISKYILTKEGTLVSEETEVPTSLLSHLADAGFTAEGIEETNTLAIQMPMTFFTETALENLDTLLAVKGDLIKKALGVTDLPVNRLEDRIEFPWFDGNASPDEIRAYEHFITAICHMAKTQKRINTCEQKTDNEKYAFRCFLLRLGFIGAEYKTERKILLRNLTGSSAFKGGRNDACMQMTAVYSCVRILAEVVAGLPLHLYRYTNDGGKEKAIDHPLYRLLHDEPNPEMSSFVFRETLMTHLLLWGNAYAQIANCHANGPVGT